MSDMNKAKAALERLVEGVGPKADQEVVRRALQRGQIILQNGDSDQTISVGRDVNNSVVIIGQENTILSFEGTKASVARDVLSVLLAPRLGSAPPVPSLFIGRDQALHDLKVRLGITSSGLKPGAMQVLTTIRGLPGVGKTTIAAALAYDDEIETAFKDGVLWISLGQNTNLLSEMAIWGRALGSEDPLRASTLEESTAQLAKLLRNKRMLLIIDDVWELEHAVPFQQVRGKDCALLVTTRETGVADALAATTPNTVYYLDVLKEEYALKLLQALVPTVINQHPGESLELVRSVECLPLAIIVAGRLLNVETRFGWGIIELLTELREGRRILEEKAPADRMDLKTQTIPSVAVLFKKSTDRLDEYTQECFALLGWFAPKPATFDLAAMKALWQVDDPKPIVRKLVDRGLLEPVGGRFQMHAMLAAHAHSLYKD